MIGEPELDTEWRDTRPAEEAEPEPPRVARPRPWLWALGGAVLASAVWAGVLTAQDRFAAAPRISYRHAEDLCKEAPLQVLGELTGGLANRQAGHGESPPLDWAGCDFNGEWPASGEPDGRIGYYGRVEVDLHKKSDPEPEFGVGLGRDPYIGPEVKAAVEVPGLGERAVLHEYMNASMLQVLDGGAVLTLTVQWTRSDGDDVDKDAVTSAAIEDVRTLMAALRKR
ncbi:hypothetical protein [Streptomyces sp. NPDC091371]|uniref:hypothetical protein n=1 Tax=Streptomyces sp. NPDC091371 TaxID=3155303 RepID=UPI003435BCCE